MKPSFFITGLPRMRGAWLAQYMSWNGGLCLHEPEAGCETIGEVCARLENLPEGAFLGVSSSGCAWFQKALRERYPEARWVVVRRDALECIRSLKRCYPDSEPGSIEKAIAEHSEKAGQIILEAGPLVVDGGDIDRSIQEIANFCVPGWVHHAARHEQLLRLNIQLRREVQHTEASATTALAARREPVEISLKAKRLSAIMGEVCAGNPAAARWWNQLLYVADTWDHVVDGDYVDKKMAGDAFEALLLDWPLNGFVRQYSAVLVPVMSAAISAWRADPGGYRAGDVYTESANAICFLLHGQEGVNRWMPEIRLLVRGLRDEDMRKDGK